MEILLDIIVPVFGIVALGYGVARLGLFPNEATKGLSRFVFDYAIPAMLFRTMATTELPDWLRFHCGAPIVADRAAAMFAFGAAEDLLPADGWPMGEAEYPDRGVTLVAEIPDFSGEALRLTGPGIESEQTLPLGPACGPVRALTAMNRALFPLGLDLILCAGTRLAAIPRTTRLQEG